ncbi:YxeA family protein [Staphylococcus argensis]|uniref:YxeA family protein n=1 Tax=Staphylococcus argensis TaxID=1607738 RepID=A0A2K4FB61_9STAP|nr:YxeA family protein [Staphylococcus argensis]MCY6991700.1 YxeA family protein [Staphylococcus argensis]POA08503.1 hypothetical protein CD039_10545 [Staphylococcus argensis]
MKALKISLTTIVIIILLIVGLLFGLKIYGEKHPQNIEVRSLNLINPVVPTKEYYVKTNKPYKQGKDIAPTYKTTGYDKDGHSKKITYTGMKKLKTNHYLKIIKKSGVVKSYEEVKKKNIPQDAREKLK